MTRPLRIQYPDAYYHVSCRGNDRKEMFRDQEDRKEFFRLLARSVDIFDVYLLAYALMPNHFHLLVCTPKETSRKSCGIDYSAVSLARKRLQLKIQHEPDCEKKFNQIQDKLCQM